MAQSSTSTSGTRTQPQRRGTYERSGGSLTNGSLAWSTVSDSPSSGSLARIMREDTHTMQKGAGIDYTGPVEGLDMPTRQRCAQGAERRNAGALRDHYGWGLGGDTCSTAGRVRATG